jgi:hypothetical protein
MGLEADCTARLGGKASAGRLQLETLELIFQSERRLRIPLAAIKTAQARRGWLEVSHAGGRAAFELGRDAEKWALRIRYPKSRIDKLGVKPGMRVAVLGVEDTTFLRELGERTDDVTSGKPRKDSDYVFVQMSDRADTARLGVLRKSIKPEGGIWVIWPKGRKEFREDDVRAAGPSLGLVDVKVVSFSDTLSGLKMVIPVALRPKTDNGARKR